MSKLSSEEDALKPPLNKIQTRGRNEFYIRLLPRSVDGTGMDVHRFRSHKNLLSIGAQGGSQPIFACLGLACPGCAAADRETWLQNNNARSLVHAGHKYARFLTQFPVLELLRNDDGSFRYLHDGKPRMHEYEYQWNSKKGWWRNTTYHNLVDSIISAGGENLVRDPDKGRIIKVSRKTEKVVPDWNHTVLDTTIAVPPNWEQDLFSHKDITKGYRQLDKYGLELVISINKDINNIILSNDLPADKKKNLIKSKLDILLTTDDQYLFNDIITIKASVNSLEL